MSEFNPEVLSVIGEAVIVARGSSVVFSNAPAEALLGGSCIGRKLPTLLGAEISGMQANEFSATAVVNGKNCIIRSSRKGGEQIFVIKEADLGSATVNDAFLYAIRESLMIMSMSAARCRTLAEKKENPDLLDMANSMSKNISSAARLVANISVVRGLKSGTLTFSPKTVDAGKLFAEYTAIISSLLPDVKINYEAADGIHVKLDPDLVKHVFTNLISNAVIHGKSKNITVRVIDGSESIMLAVDDDGCGIESDQLYNIFERYRGVIELNNISRGAGLGLSVVMGIARLHGGTVMLESRAGRGTAVRVSMRKSGGRAALYSGLGTADDVKDFLVGLADCIEERRFSEVYGDD